MYQQGDVLLKTCAIDSENGKLFDGDLLHKGEQHHHRLRGKFEMYDDGGVRHVRVIEPTELFHEEHKTIELPPGEYKLDLVREYDHWDEESRAVID
jgi:hypothetical protein